MRKRKLIVACICLIITGTAGILLFILGIRSISKGFFPESVPTGAAEETALSAETKSVYKPSPKPALPPEPIPHDVSAMMGLMPSVAEEMTQRSNMFARLIIPEAGINVALFTEGTSEIIPSIRQGIVDTEDSALLYYEYESGCGVIADHNTQSFSALFNVAPGQSAYFVTARSVLKLNCTRTIDGHNNAHKSIVDENYSALDSPGDFICYTCMDMWQNVRIAVFDIQKEYFLT